MLHQIQSVLMIVRKDFYIVVFSDLTKIPIRQIKT